MQLKHINLATSDVAGLAAFLGRFFGFSHYAPPRGDAFVVMRNEQDFVVTLMRAKGERAAYPDTFHIGFYADSVEGVQAKHDELSAAGLSPGKISLMGRGGGARASYFYCTAPGNVVVEVSTPPGG